jgi:hypothetical protein
MRQAKASSELSRGEVGPCSVVGVPFIVDLVHILTCEVKLG